MDPADPDPAVPDRSDADAGRRLAPRPRAARPARRRPTRRRRSLLSISIAVVAILGRLRAVHVRLHARPSRPASDPGTPASDAAAFQPFWDTYHTINDRYAGGDVDRTTLIQGAIRGMIDSLGDPYSAYLSSDEYRQSLQGISGQFEGIGAEITSQALDGTEGCTPLGRPAGSS